MKAPSARFPDEPIETTEPFAVLCMRMKYKTNSLILISQGKTHSKP